MATVTVAGPYFIDFGNQPLAPGQDQKTWWFGWRQAFYLDFTVTVTAHPWSASPGGGAGNALWVRETSVSYDAEDKLRIYATLHNSGPAAIRACLVYISFLREPQPTD
jgi:hypothetical protein